MLNNNETKNVQLNLEQLQQIDAVEQKLAGLNTQVSVANKNLLVINKDTLRYAKEIEAQKILLDTLIPQVEEKKAESVKLSVEISEKTSILSKLTTEFKEYAEKIESEKMAHKNREDAISAKEFELECKESSLCESKKSLDIQQKIHDEKVAKLKEVISTF
jgi:hypothetical protein